jgi:aminoglycoside phosphotransferase
MNLPHGYTNRTWRSGTVVNKVYLGAGADLRLATETLALRHLAGHLPIPKVLHVDETRKLIQTAFIAGLHGQTLIEQGEAEQVLFLCGTVLMQIQQISPEALFGAQDASGLVIGHGDFGPQNLLFSQSRESVVAILDWEWMHLARPSEDLAWAEWIVRTHHATAYDALSSLLAGYGSRPSWTERHAEMMLRCRSVLALAEESGDQDVIAEWRRRNKATELFTE